MNGHYDGAVWERDLRFLKSLERYLVADLCAQLIELARH